MTFTLLTRILADSELTHTAADVGKTALFYDDEGASYYSTILAFLSASSVVLSVGSNLPTEDITIYDLALIDAGTVSVDNAILCVTEVKNFLKINLTDTSKDAFIQGLINDESLIIEEELQRKVIAQTITDEVGDGDGTNKYYPVYAPIIDICDDGGSDADRLASVRVRNTPDDPYAPAADNINYLIYGQGKAYVALYDGYFPEGRNTVKITYRAGWLTVPSSIKSVCMDRVVEQYENSHQGSGRFGLQSVSKSEGGGSGTTSYKDFAPEHKRKLAPYKRVAI